MQSVLEESWFCVIVQGMKRYIFLALAALLAPAAAQSTLPQTNVLSTWVQYGPGGTAEVRALVRDPQFGCPQLLRGDNSPLGPMVQRAAASANFPLVCAAPYPAGKKYLRVGFLDETRGGVILDVIETKTHKLSGVALPTPVPDLPADPQRILVLGDTGCRIKGTALQACNDPVAWPFAGLAKAAADLKPDLIVHLGDYLYRESACPAGNAGCAGSPFGDNWDAWNADFFTPAAPLLAAAPWIVIRGNHEDCYRAGPGFLRLLGPVAYDPAAPCIDHLDPYAVMAGSQMIAIVDTAMASDTTLDDKTVAFYEKDFEALKAMANVGTGHELWFATHRPIWAAITGPLGVPIGGNINRSRRRATSARSARCR